MPPASRKPVEPEFELVTSSRQLAPPPELRKEIVEIDEWLMTSGKKAKFMVWELTGAEWSEFMESGRVYSKDGQFRRYESKDEDMRFLSCTIRDQHRNRIWPSADAATVQLGQLGRTSLLKLINAANLVNTPKAASAEGNSEETLIDS